MSPEERSLLIDQTRSTPSVKFDKITKLAGDTVNNLKRFPVGVDVEKPITVMAEVLPQQELEYSARVRERPSDKGTNFLFI
jgi:hypothetical protein